MNNKSPHYIQAGAAASFPPVLPSSIVDASGPVASPLATNDGGEEIQVSHQDVLFGRGGLTNRHIGNLRYRDVIALHRADYVRASKVEKPSVARRIVKAIRTGRNPGRFLRRGDDGKWHEVSDKEAAWKASQALREKTRWSSMKQQKAAQEIAEGSSKANELVEKVIEKATKSVNEKTNKKRKFKEEEAAPSSQKRSALSAPTDTSQISIPDLSVARFCCLRGSKAALGSIIPRDEDVLFGRGGKTNHHPGNIRLRQIVLAYRSIYRQAKKVDKPKVAKLIVGALRAATPPSRFLRLNDTNNQWEDVGDRRAAEKVSQTLREKDKDDKDSSKATGIDDEEEVDNGLAARMNAAV